MLLKVKRVVPRAYEIYYKGQNIISLIRPKPNVDAKREAGEKIDPTDVIDINAVSVEDFKDIEEGEVTQEQPTTEKSSDIQH